MDFSKLEDLEAIQAARSENRNADGAIANHALDHRLQVREREIAIEVLGWEPETGDPADCYCASTSSMIRLIAMKLREAA